MLQCPCCGYDNALELKDDEAKRGACNQTGKCVNPRCSSELRGVKLGKARTVARCELYGKFEAIKHAARHRCKGYHVSHDLQLLIDHGDVDALAAREQRFVPLLQLSPLLLLRPQLLLRLVVRHAPAQGRVQRFEHLAHRSFPKEPRDLEVANLLGDRWHLA